MNGKGSDSIFSSGDRREIWFMKDFNETQDTLHLVNAWRRNIIGFGESTVPSD